MDKVQMIDKLNEILKWEYAGLVQYTQFSFLVQDTWREVFSKFFRENGEEALDHAHKIGDKIVSMGGVPTVERGEVKQTLDLREMLEFSLEVESKQVQLYTEGPNDKLIALVAVDRYRARVEIGETQAGIPELAYLGGAELGQLLDRERLATAWALTQARRPNLTITVPEIDAGIVGEFFFLHQLQTVMAGALYGVNPFGQPGVEAGKNATYALMGREGYEALRGELLAGPEDGNQFVLKPA